tara:strand:+ start:1920 stop:2141 length:222 start_codon:yes stop_codon:yes gene_type:complete
MIEALQLIDLPAIPFLYFLIFFSLGCSNIILHNLVFFNTRMYKKKYAININKIVAIFTIKKNVIELDIKTIKE